MDNENATWTADRVRKELPNVPVLLNNQEYATGVIAGRLNRFAAVRLDSEPTGATWEVSWDTLASILNRGGVLRI